MLRQLNIMVQSIDIALHPEKRKDPNIKDEKLPVEELIYTKGYPLEIHNIETTDGYILRCLRIPGGKDEQDWSSKIKPPVLFQHGLLDSADGWLCNAEEKSLPYIMANEGFDVWLNNSRGNKHSKCHKEFSPVSFEFWQFSFHEMGIYDVPAVLEHIKKYNLSKEKVIYVGHSQGTCMMFAALTEKLEYFKENIKLFVACAPVARVSNVSSGLLKMLESVKFHKLLKTTNHFEVFPSDEDKGEFGAWVNKHFPSLSNMIIDLVSDKHSKENNTKERLGVYLTHYPSGTSLKSLNHFVSNYKCKKFCYYDYKEEANMHIYHQKTPPEYDLSKIKDFPIMLLAGTEDKLASLQDVRWLKEQLGSNVVFYAEYENMGHISFLMGKNMDWFDEAFEVIKKFAAINDYYKTD